MDLWETKGGRVLWELARNWTGYLGIDPVPLALCQILIHHACLAHYDSLIFGQNDLNVFINRRTLCWPLGDMQPGLGLRVDEGAWRRPLLQGQTVKLGIGT